MDGLKDNVCWVVVAVLALALNPSVWEAEAVRSELKASLVYRVSSEMARATLESTVSKSKTNKPIKQSKVKE